MEQKIYHAPSSCPVCGNGLKIVRVKCDECGSELSGNFSPCKFCTLEEKHLQFIETFLRCRGSIKEVEKALGISYPTVRNMMDSALTALGLNTPKPAGNAEEKEKSEILEKLSNKEIGVDAAIQALAGLKGEKK